MGILKWYPLKKQSISFPLFICQVVWQHHYHYSFIVQILALEVELCKRNTKCLEHVKGLFEIQVKSIVTDSSKLYDYFTVRALRSAIM